MMEGSKTARGFVVFVFATVLFGSLLASPIVASNDQGLYWGVSVGQRFDYMVSRSTVVSHTTETAREHYYVIVSWLSEILEHVTTMGDLSSIFSYLVYYENGTATESLDYLWLARPVGNWSLLIKLWLSEMSQMALTQEDIIDTPVLAGFNHTHEGADLTFVYSGIYQKPTGVLCDYLFVIIAHGESYDIYTRTEISLIESGSWTVLAVGGAVLGGILIIAAVIIKRR